MSNIKIQNLPLLTPLDAMKIPTGGFGDYAITVSTLANYLMTSRDIATTTQLLAHSSNTNNPHSVTKEQVGLGSVDNTSDIDKPVSTLQQSALDLKEDKNRKGVANGYASLDADGKVPQTQLPSYTDDVVNADSFALLPISGELGKIYITTDTNNIYRWNGVEYVDLNTLGIAKYADQLTVAKSITAVGDANWSVDFNGTNNVSGTLTLSNTGVVSGTYPKVTVDSKGRVTSGTNLTLTDIPQVGVPNGLATLDATSKLTFSQLPSYPVASTTVSGIVQLVNDLVTGGTDKALTAEQGKTLGLSKVDIANFVALKQNNGYLKIPTSGGGDVILQWSRHSINVSANTITTISGSFPIAFPTAVTLAFPKNTNNVDARITIEGQTTTGFNGFAITPASSTINYTVISIGW